MLSIRFGIGLFAATLAGATTYNCVTFSAPGASSTNISGINNALTMVGSYSTNGVTHGFIANTASSGFQTVDYPGSMNTQLFAINNNGVAAGEYNFGISGQTPGWFTVDSNGNFTTITVPAYQILSIYGINDQGAISAYLESGPGTSFAIIGTNGSVTLISGAGIDDPNVAGSINNTPLVLESDHSFGTTRLVDTSNTVIPISYPYPGAAEVHTYGFGLNNLGNVIGYFSPGILDFEPPFIGFERDSSGAYSEAVCPGISFFTVPAWQAINDNGVIAGGIYIGTPVSGEPQVSFTSNNLAFPDTAVGQTSAPQNVTLSNSGNARLDIASILSSSSEFQVTGCVDPATHTASLDPGASCTVAVTAKPSASGPRTGTLAMNDSAPGAPHLITLSVTGISAAPSCQVSSATPTQVTFTMQDTNSGLSSIILVDASNANVNIPSFASGTKNPVTVVAGQMNSSQISKVDFKVTNVGGGAASCGATFGGPTGWTGIGGSFTGKIVTVTNADGRLQNFVRGTDNALWTIAQSSPDSGWTSWQSLGGILTSDASVAVNRDGRLEAFVIGSDGALWHIWQTSAGGPWSGWESLGGYITSDPAAITNQDGRLEVFVVGGDQSLWHIWQTSAGGGWSEWTSLGGGIASNPTVVVNADGRLEAFVVGMDQALWHIGQTAANSGWGGWSSLGGIVKGDPAPSVNQDGRLEVFVRGSDDQLYHIWQSSPGGSWVGYSALGGMLTSNPAIGMNADGRLEAFVRGPDSALWLIAQTAANGGWGSWETLGGVLSNGPTPGLNQDGRMEAFVEGTDAALWYIEQTAPGFWN